MIKKIRKPLKEELLDAVNIVLTDNKADLTNKIEKIVKKTNKQLKKNK